MNGIHGGGGARLDPLDRTITTTTVQGLAGGSHSTIERGLFPARGRAQGHLRNGLAVRGTILVRLTGSVSSCYWG